MHTVMEVNPGVPGTTQGTHVPAFLAKLWRLVDDAENNDLICWSETGNSFIIRNQAKFARDLLPLYYKHNNMASFVRQLNMYGFHKVVSVEQGGLKVDKDEMEFAHPFFLRGQETSLELIKRKIPAAKHDESRIRPDSLQKVLMDVRHMKGRQENMDTKLLTMKRENEALWREIASLRQKHAKQTQIVSKLLQFLVGMMSSQTHRLGFKRRMPLMLNDTNGPKERKHSRNEVQDVRGPVIHDVTEIFEADDSGDDQDHSDYLTGSSGSDGDNHPKVDSPVSAPSKSPYPESILGMGSDDSREMLFPVDPSSINPAMNALTGALGLQQLQDERNGKVKSKGRSSARKTGPSAPTPSSSTRGMNGSNSQAQFLQSIPVQTQATSTVTSAQLNQMNQVYSQPPMTYYLAGTAGTEPVEVVLSIPDTPRAQTTDAGVNTDAVTITTATSTVSQPQKMEQAQTLSMSTMDMVPMMSDGVVGTIGRTHSHVQSPQYPLKPKITVTEDLDGHLDDMQVGLDNLRDILRNDDYKMDHSTLHGVSWPLSSYTSSIDPHQLFGDGELDFARSLQEGMGSTVEPGTSNVSGQEVVSYSPSLFELTEDDSQFFDDSSNVFLDDELESMLTTDRENLSRTQSQGGSSTLSFTSALNNQGGNNSSGITTPVGSGSILGAVSGPAAIAPRTVTTTNVSGAGKRKRK